MRKIYIPVLLLLVAAFVPADADARGNFFRGVLVGVQEVPAISTDGIGLFRAHLRSGGDELEFELSYAQLEGEVAQSHLHFGQRGVNGGISIFLCTNLGNGPAGTQECPPPPATITGTVSADDVIGPGGQGISAGEWEEFKRALRLGKVYANVHTDLHPAGEIRGQLH